MLGITQLTYTAIIAFLIVVILGPIFIPMLAKFKFGQTVRDDGPQTHLQKNGTPTMGGIIMIIAILITGLTRAKVDKDLLVGLICITGFGLVGFLDDFIKIKMKRSLGLKAYQKIVLQFALALFVAYYQYSASPSATQIMVPFTDYVINLGPLYVPIMMFIIIGTVNAVNLTDGLDGLVAGLAIISFLTYSFISYIQHQYCILLICLALSGALLGFLFFNHKPAKIFMGDVGSLSLGGTLAVISLLLHREFSLLFIGIIYIIETLSVILQVTYFKITGKRLFKMSPIHHHFEMLGWSEWQIDIVFWLISIIFSLIYLYFFIK